LAPVYAHLSPDFPAEFFLIYSRNINMNASKFLIPTAATIAFASIIGIAYAQTGTTDSNRDATGSGSTTSNRSNADATLTQNRDTTGAMQRNSPATTNRDSTGNMNRSSTNDRSNERVARADRN